MVSGLWMWAVSDIKLVTSVECGVGYCMRFALIFVKIWEIVSCVEIPGFPSTYNLRHCMSGDCRPDSSPQNL